MKNTIKIVFVIIASIIGAGFASGKEIYSFFFIYGKEGILGIILSNIIISLVIYKVLVICKKNNINTYFQFCDYIVNKNKFFSQVLNNIVNIFLLISFFIMIVGFASLLEQELNISRLFGAIFIIIFNYIFSIKKTEGIIRLSNCLIPFFLFFLLIIIFKNNNFSNLFNYIFNKNDVMFNSLKLTKNTNNINISNFLQFITNNWIIKGILYASYNCVIIIPIIVIIAQKINTQKSIINISIINFFILTFFSISIFSLLLEADYYLYELEMPVVAIVAKFGKKYRLIYIFLLMISIITSVVSASVGFLNNISNNSKKLKRNLIIISLLAIPISYISFGDLVTCLYPILGFIGLIELIQLTHLEHEGKRKDCWQNDLPTV